MNDLDLMENFRADVSPADPAALARARAAMFRDAPAPRHRWAWRLAPAAALAAVAAAVTVVALREPAAAPPPAPEAARVLRLAAAEVRHEPALSARPDQFVYVESLVAWGGAEASGHKLEDARYVPPVEKNRRIWLSVDGTRDGLLRERATDPGQADHGSVLKSVPIVVKGQPVPAYADDLPTEPEAMRDFLYSGEETKNDADDAAFAKVGDTLREQYVTPKAMAAMFEAAATIPDTTVVTRTDLAGRKGTAVSHTHNGIRHDLIFDPGTYRFLGERDVVVDSPPFPRDAVIGWTAQLRIAVVDRAGQLP